MSAAAAVDVLLMLLHLSNGSLPVQQQQQARAGLMALPALPLITSCTQRLSRGGPS
jgi:hypothetical protein